MFKNRRVLLASSLLLSSPLAYGEDTVALAKKLANPIAALISLPIQANYDENYGQTEEGSVWKTNLQPVIPFSISQDWNVISRTIVPIVDQKDIPQKGDDTSGMGDITQSFFLSPKAPTSDGWIWGVGPAVLIDSANDQRQYRVDLRLAG